MTLKLGQDVRASSPGPKMRIRQFSPNGSQALCVWGSKKKQEAWFDVNLLQDAGTGVGVLAITENFLTGPR